MRSVLSLLLLFGFSVGCVVEPEPSTLRMTYPHELVTLDPHDHVDSVTRSVLTAVYESLVFFEPGLPVRAGLSDRWTTPDNFTWHLHIRDGVSFHDGRPLTPGDAVASIKRARKSKVAGHQLDEILDVRELPGADRIIEITTREPAPLLLTRLESVPVVPADFDPQVPVGTGPYEWRIGSVQGPILLQRWDGYWAEPPDFAEVSIQFVPFQEDLASLIHHGKVDVVAAVPFTFVKDHREIEGWRVVASPAVATAYLGLNSSLSELADIRVREAIDLSIDRPHLVASVFPEGAAQPAFSMVPPEVFGYSPDHRKTEVDRDRARRLLAEYGGRRKEPLRLAYSERNQLVAEHLVAELVEIGLDVEGELLPYDVLYRRLQEASSDLFVFTWTYRVADASKFLDTFVRSRDPGRGFGTFNGVALADPEIDALIENAVIEPNSVLRLEKLQQAVADVGEKSVYLPLYKPSGLALVRMEFAATTQGHPMLRPQDFRPVE